ncbi:MAG: fused MFS/spermidine synthase [Armatimonadota bacterium]|nr:fused MFS/spermidine synthase [Armatimonadota bacterium]
MNSVSKTGHPLAQSLAIWLLVFSGGWFVMLTELIGARVLAPYFGNTIYVWGSVIAIFLLALAVGYAIGGRMTRRFSSALVPAGLVAAAGLYIAATPFYQDALCAWLYTTGMHVKWGALFASTVLYGPPTALLGGVSPYCVQIATKTRAEVGRRAGALYAVSTIGSFIGCLITAFFLIPALPLSQITLCGGVGVAWVALIVALALSNRTTPALLALVPILGVFVFAAVKQPGKSWYSDIPAYAYPLKGQTLADFPPEQLGARIKEAQALANREVKEYAAAGRKSLLDTETPYHHISVVQEGPSRLLIFGKSGFHQPQTALDLRNLNWHVAEYTHLTFAGLLYQPAPKRVCVIGVGGAVIPRAMELCAPGVRIDAVDIDPAVIHVARKYFFWRPSRNVRVYGQDGRSFINWAVMNGHPLYDWIVLDAYNDEYVPFHLTTVEFISTVKRMLAPGGVLTVNMCIDDALYGCEARTFNEVFGNVTAFEGNHSGNIVLVCQNGPRKGSMNIYEAAKAARRLRLPPEARIDMRAIVRSLQQTQKWNSKGPILTDIWAPVENLIK